MTREWLRSGFLAGVGILMIGFWSMLFLTGQIPEGETGPVELGYHLAAELLTASVLVTAGVGRQLQRRWARRLSPVALGMLGYTVINSAGYYAQSGEISMVAMFTLLTVSTVALILDYLNATPESG